VAGIAPEGAGGEGGAAVAEQGEDGPGDGRPGEESAGGPGDADRDAEGAGPRLAQLPEGVLVDQLFEPERRAVDAGDLQSPPARRSRVVHREVRRGFLRPPTRRANRSAIGVRTPSCCAALARSSSPSMESFCESWWVRSRVPHVRWRSPISVSTTPRPWVATARYTGSSPRAASSSSSSSLRISGRSRLLNWMTSGILP